MQASGATVRGHAVVVHAAGVPLEPSDRVGCGIITCGRVNAPPVHCSGAQRGQCNEEGHCECTTGHWKEDCSGTCPTTAAGVCSAHGTCSFAEGGCNCELGYAGAFCNITCPGNTGSPIQPCSAHGTCSADGKCSCDRGYFGATCATSCPGFDVTHPNGGCSGHGVCSLDEGKCSCSSGFYGDDCARECPRDASHRVCGGHGFCSHTQGTCVCDYGWNMDSQSHACTLECPGGADNPCSGHGRCEEDGACSCTPGYAGADCNAPCPNANSGGPACNYPQGFCNATDNTCVCNAPFHGAACTQNACADNCNNHGVCHGSEGCRCEQGWYGVDCANECPGGEQNPCNGVHRGVCTAEGVCACLPGFFGDICEDTCPTTPEGLVCNNQGDCTPAGDCQCTTGWLGANCTVRMDSPQSETNVDLILSSCHTDNPAWLFGVQEDMARKFHVNPQRLQIRTCVAQPDATQLATVEIYGVPGVLAISSASLSQKMAAEISSNATWRAQFGIAAASVHTIPSPSSGGDGVSTGGVVAIVIVVGLSSLIAAALYFKYDMVERHMRKARRLVRTLCYGDQLDMGNDGTSYGDGHTGAMHKADAEITYQLDGTADAEDDEHISIPSPVRQLEVDKFTDPEQDQEMQEVNPAQGRPVTIPEQHPMCKQDDGAHSGL
eukprot:TRINITY_DN5907_c0_g1_i4.p1 TRINITY_DN5907_c0_g1~~TRINITY_DN5907_c0_g1_i4.p1  ORF type:complete len:664 (+),score=108.84 TRINITY_DN5907_c0_g1_i4:2139-4130(+)